MKLDMQVALSVLDGDPAQLRKRVHTPIFGRYLLWPNGWMNQDAIGREVGLGPSDTVLDGDPAPLPNKGAEPPPKNKFGPCLL